MTRLKDLTDLEWLRLAASGDDARGALKGIYVEQVDQPKPKKGQDPAPVRYQATTTQGHLLLHVDNVDAFREGLWDAKTFEPIDSKFPTYMQVFPQGEATWRIADPDGMWEVLTAAQAAQRVTSRDKHKYDVSLPVQPAYGQQKGIWYDFDPGYLMDILRGGVFRGGTAMADGKITFGEGLCQIRWGEVGRTALVMRVRRGDEGGEIGSRAPRPRFDLSEFVEWIGPNLEELARPDPDDHVPTPEELDREREAPAEDDAEVAAVVGEICNVCGAEEGAEHGVGCPYHAPVEPREEAVS